MQRRGSLCQSCLAVLLKFLVFLQAFAGVSIIIYGVWVLNHYHRKGLTINFNLDHLPAPWFVCGLFGVGALLCVIAFVGQVAAEAVNGCCHCFYSVLTTVLILLEVALAGVLLLDKHWEEDLPNDSTGELRRLRTFIESNFYVCTWVAATVAVVQVLSLLLAVVVRAMIPGGRTDYDSDEDFVVIRRPLLTPQGTTPYVAAPVDTKGFHSDLWSSRMREKYGLNQGDFHYSAADPKATCVGSSCSDQNLCSIM